MKKKICILLSVVLCMILASCNFQNREISMKEFEEKVDIYKSKIQSIDATLKIKETISVCEDGDHIVVYSIEASTGACFGIILTVISSKKAELVITFDNSNEEWFADNINLFTSFISELTNYGLQFDEIKSVIDSMEQLDYHRFNRKASLSWDDYHSALCYTETFQIDDVP